MAPTIVTCRNHIIVPQPLFSVAAPASITPTLTEGLANGGFEGVYVGGLAPSWAKAGAITPTESADAHGGSKAQAYTASTDASKNVRQDMVLAAQSIYRASSWLKMAGGSGVLVMLFRTFIRTSNAASYTQVKLLDWTTTGLHGIAFYANDGTAQGLIDDASVSKLTLSTCLGAAKQGGPGGYYYIDPTVPAEEWGGLAKVNSTSNPTNAILAYVNRGDGKAYLDKIASGTRTNLVNGAVAYGAGKRIAWNQVGNSVQLYYDGATVGAAQDVGATLGALDIYVPFATAVSVTFANFKGLGRMT